MIFTTITVVSLLTASVCYREIIKFVFKCIDTPPGVSKIYKTRGSYFIETNIGKFRLNHHKTPCLDLDVYFFNKGNDLDQVTQNKLIKKVEFEKEFLGQDTTLLRKYNFGIIGDIYYPRQFKGRNKLVGFMTNVFDEDVFVFVVDENNMIDYKELFLNYTKAMEDGIKEEPVNELDQID